MNLSIKTSRLVLGFATLTLALALSACGGGGSSGITASNQTSGPDDTMVTEPETTTPPAGDGRSPASGHLTSFGDSPVKALFFGPLSSPRSSTLIENISRPAAIHQPTASRSNVDIRVHDATGTVLQSYPGLPASGRGFLYATQIKTVEISAGFRTLVSSDGTSGVYRPSENYPESEFADWTKGYEGKKGRLYYHADTVGSTFYADHMGVIGDRGSDYLAWGYWLRSRPGTRGSPFGGNLVYGSEVGAFIGGPGFIPRDSNDGLLRGSAGTATYSGESRGIFHQQYGSSPEIGGYSAAIELGQYVQPLSIDVDFGTGSVNLCGGCGGAATAISVDGRRQDGPFYQYEGPAFSFFQYEATTTVGNEGTFDTSTISLTSTNPENPIINHGGRIQGIFSIDRDSQGRPVMVIGTSGSSYEYQDGTEGYFIGTFGAKVDP